MDTAVRILAVAGFIAVAWRMLRALVRALTRSADVVAARSHAAVRAQHGDITGLQEADRARGSASRRRYVALGVFSFWAGLLLVPTLTPWPYLLYAGYSLLWLWPRRSSRALPT
jgi:hypothetical protein